MGASYGGFVTFQNDFCGYVSFRDLIFNFDRLVLFLIFALFVSLTLQIDPVQIVVALVLKFSALDVL
jgi:hypothetical protein